MWVEWWVRFLNEGNEVDMSLYYNSLAKIFSFLSGWISGNIRMVLLFFFSHVSRNPSFTLKDVCVCNVPFKSRTKVIYWWTPGKGPAEKLMERRWGGSKGHWEEEDWRGLKCDSFTWQILMSLTQYYLQQVLCWELGILSWRQQCLPQRALMLRCCVGNSG